MGAYRLDFNFRVNRKKNLAGQRISNKMLKKKFFIHLFFSQESQYDILGTMTKNPCPVRSKIAAPNQTDLQLYSAAGLINI